MADAQLTVEFGTTKFNAQGAQDWVDEKFESFIAHVKEMRMPVQSVKPAKINANGDAADDSSEIGPLAIFLKEVNVGASQNKRFLATAVWLKRQGQTTIQTSSVVKALSDAQQQRLGNPADVLNQNVKKGFCVKTSDGFYVTPEGEDSLTSTEGSAK